MLSILASGTLIADPVERRSVTGKAYATASMRVPAEDSDPVLVSVISFNADAVQALLTLARGDSCAIAGRAKLSEWTGQNGEEKHGLSVVADKMLTVYQAGKQRKAAREIEEVPA